MHLDNAFSFSRMLVSLEEVDKSSVTIRKGTRGEKLTIKFLLLSSSVLAEVK